MLCEFPSHKKKKKNVVYGNRKVLHKTRPCALHCVIQIQFTKLFIKYLNIKLSNVNAIFYLWFLYWTEVEKYRDYFSLPHHTFIAISEKLMRGKKFQTKDVSLLMALWSAANGNERMSNEVGWWKSERRREKEWRERESQREQYRKWERVIENDKKSEKWRF